MTTTDVASIAEALGATDRLDLLDGGPAGDLAVTAAAAADMAGPGTITFLTASAANRIALRDPGPTLLLLDEQAQLDSTTLRSAHVGAVIRTPRPRLDFIRAVRTFLTPPRPAAVHPSAVIADSATLGTGVAVGPLCTIGNRCRVGDGTVLDAGVHLYDDVTIGRNVHIHAGAVIGLDGFGHERNEDGVLEHFPHVGTVEIADDVDVGANTCIAKGALGSTRIGRGTKINGSVFIAHNVEIGEDCFVTPHVTVCGSARIGRRVWLGPSACIRDNVTVGDGATVGLGAIVTTHVAENASVIGSPARDLKEFRSLLAVWRRQLTDEDG